MREESGARDHHDGRGIDAAGRASRWEAPTKRAARVLLGACAALTACTYAPAEERVRILQVIRVGDAYRAVVVAQYEEVQRPTGLSAFPDGGRWRYLRRRGIAFLLDADAHEIRPLVSLEAPDSLWESFTPWLAGLEGDSVAYLSLTGCPRGGECHPRLQQQRFVRLSLNGDSRAIDSIPGGVGLRGGMLAREPGEERYVRFGTSADTITARLEEDGPYRPLFRLRPDGTTEVVPR